MPEQKHKERNQNTPAAYLALIKDDSVLLLRRYNTGYEDGKYGVPAGHVEFGESFTQCMIREAKEEVGLTLTADNLEVVHVMHRRCPESATHERVEVFFTASQWEGEPRNMGSHKCDELAWFKLDQLPENLMGYTRQAIEKIQNGVYYSEWGW